jgi:hypothetical protein
MRLVSVNLERCGIYGVGAKVEVEVVLLDRAMLGSWLTASPIEVSASAPFRIWVISSTT